MSHDLLNESPQTPERGPVPSDKLDARVLLTAGVVVLGAIMSILDITVVSVGLRTFQTVFHATAAEVAWTMTGYTLALASVIPLTGWAADRFGTKRLYILAVVLFTLGSALCSTAPSLELLVTFRILQGLGGGMLMPLGMTIMTRAAGPERIGRVMAVLGVPMLLGPIFGPILGGWLIDIASWHWIFLINVPIGIAALVVTSAALKLHHVRRDHTIDYLGAATIVASVSSILLYTAWAGPDRGWGDTLGLGLVVLGLLLAVLFVWIEKRADEPILPMRLFSNSVFSLSNTFGFLIGVAMFGTMIFMPVYLQVVDGMSPTKSGLAMVPMIAGIFSTSITAGQIMSRTGRYKPFPVVGAVAITGALFLMSRLGVDSPYWHAAIAMYLFGMGLGLTMQVLIVVVQNSVDRSDIGVATSSVAFFRQMGGSFGTALFGAILTSRLATHLAELLPAGTSTGQVNTNDVQAIKHLPAAARTIVETAFSRSLSDMFLTAVPLVVLAGVVALFIKELPLGARQAPAQESATSSPDSSESSDAEAGSSSAASRGSSPTSV